MLPPPLYDHISHMVNTTWLSRSSLNSFNKYFLSKYYVPGTLWGFRK
jgi:hypothetical protein